MHKLYFICADKLRLPPSEVDKLEFYFLEYLLKDLEEKVEEENKQYKKQEEDQKRDYKMDQFKNPGQMAKSFGQSSGVNVPSGNSFKMPNVSVPKLSMPKL